MDQPKTKPTPGLHYLGTMDDMVAAYPWDFKLTDKMLERNLAIQLISGRPVLLNDGYLVQHPLAREALKNNGSLLWDLMNVGYVRVMARGKGNFALDEMPVRMANQGGVDTARRLIESPEWPDIRASLQKLDKILRDNNGFIGWPQFDNASGFHVLAKRLIPTSTAHSVGIGKHVTNEAFDDFLKRFDEKMQAQPTAARTKWENLAKEMSNNLASKKKGVAFVRSLMNLGNEMYHYNMGLLLAADRKEPVTVETRVSDAFNDLVMADRQYLLEEFEATPRLNIPQGIHAVPPNILVQILEEHRPVSQARTRWLDLSRKHADTCAEDLKELCDARDNYAARLAEHVGAHVRLEKQGSIAHEVLSYVLKNEVVKPAAASVGSTAIAAALGYGILANVAAAGVGLAAPFVIGYVVKQVQSRIEGPVVRKVRIVAVKKYLKSGATLAKSAKLIRQMAEPRVLAAMEISPERATQVTKNVTKFVPI